MGKVIRALRSVSSTYDAKALVIARENIRIPRIKPIETSQSENFNGKYETAGI
jgi:hypothetical protein